MNHDTDSRRFQTAGATIRSEMTTDKGIGTSDYWRGVKRPLAIDLFCGLGGWAEGFLAEGYDVIGFDIERHRYPRYRPVSDDGGCKVPGNNSASRWSDRPISRLKDAKGELIEGHVDEYPGQLVIQDVLTLHGSQFRDAAVIVASPPCQAYSYRAMPWKRARALPPPSNELFDACFRIQREACEAADRYIPLVVENVKGAQPWVGRAKWHYGSFYLWGDVPALMPPLTNYKGFGGSWFAENHNTNSGSRGNPVDGSGIKQHGSGETWFDHRVASLPSNSARRKAASAQIAKIPFPLAQHIARCYFPPVRMEVSA